MSAVPSGPDPGEVERRLWAWLPARTDRRRVTTSAVAAANLGLDEAEVGAALGRMERSGHAVRDRRYGARAGWHRGLPYPQPAADPEGGGLW